MKLPNYEREQSVKFITQMPKERLYLFVGSIHSTDEKTVILIDYEVMFLPISLTF